MDYSTPMDYRTAVSELVRNQGRPPPNLLRDAVNNAVGLPRPMPATPGSPDYDETARTLADGDVFRGPNTHGTDLYKLPNHPTFSTHSQYSQPGVEGGQWLRGGMNRWVFTPSEHNLRNLPPDEMARYFQNRERQGTVVQLPNGRTAEGRL